MEDDPSLTTRLGLPSDRGVNELLGFILILGVVLGTAFLGVVLAADSLAGASQTQSVTFAEQSFENVKNDAYEVVADVPYRATEVSPQGGTLSYADPITIEISAQTGAGDSFTMTANPEPLTFEQEQGTVYFEGGAVIYQQENSPGSLNSPPRLQIGDNRSIIQFIETRQSGSTGTIGGAGDSISVVSHLWNRDTEQVEAASVGGTTVTLTISSPRYQAWADYFRDKEDVTVSSVDDSATEVVAEFTTTEVVAVVGSLNMKYESETSR